MPPPASIPSELKALLVSRRAEIRALHSTGASGLDVARATTAMVDAIVWRAFSETTATLPDPQREDVPRHLALVAVGGYGRGDLAPYSDVDLLFLHAPRPSAVVRETISQLVRTLWDAGLKLSQSVRTPAGCIGFARQDFKARTALIERRLVAGSRPLFEDLDRRTRRLFSPGAFRRFVRQALAERAEEHRDHFTATACLLEPNVKTSPGGLRDLHLLRWVATARYGEHEPEQLRRCGLLSAEDADALAGASEFLHRIRNELHFRAGTAQDLLSREEQLRLAEWLGFPSDEFVLGVERFMQQYYRHTTTLQDIVARFVERAGEPDEPPGIFDRLRTRHVADGFVIERGYIGLDPHAPADRAGQAETALRLFDLSRGLGIPVNHATLERIRKAASSCEVTPAARSLFFQCLAKPQRLGDLLRNLHRARLLERLIPAVAHARCLIQFNRFHAYTVDEHSIRAVEAAARRLDDPGPVGRAYRECRRKDLLHLALLLHDLGKGLGPDHCEAGRRIAEETAGLFGLDTHDRHALVWLVHNHLLMALTAFRRDVADDRTVLQFSREVASAWILRMLYVLTAADTEAVAPGEWTAWKESLVTELYVHAAEALSGEAPGADEPARAEAIRERLCTGLRADFEADWLRAQLAVMPPRYLMTTEPTQVAEHLRILRTLADGDVQVASQYLSDVGLCRYTVFAHDDLTPGLFSKIAGVLAAERFQVVDAQIVTRPDGVVIDTFRGTDTDFGGEPPLERRQEVSRKIEDVLCGRVSVDEIFARRGRPLGRRGRAARPVPAQVEIDNDSSDRFTVVDIFADDRLGLLYAIARALFECGLSVHSAKISTHIDQIVDAFYVTDAAGRKVTSSDRIEAIRTRLLDAIGA